MSKRKNRVSTDGGQALGDNPFASIDSNNLPKGAASAQSPAKAKSAESKPRSRGRLDIKREKTGRGGKTVTVVYGWKGISLDEKTILMKRIQKRCGVGGAIKDGNIEIQGDKREEVKAVLEEDGFRAVFAGG